MSSSTSHSTAQSSERPERSRNAKAQARHRAKRKAYIEQLEQTVTKLQIAMGYSTEQVSCLPPPLLKIRELEQDNSRLQKENDDLRRILTDSSSRSLDSRRSAAYDVRSCDRDYGLKRRKPDGMYISPSDTPPHPSDGSRPPPPLTIPQPLSHHYTSMGSNSLHGSNASSSVFNVHGPTFQMPNTPSGSSATSSPPFSPTHLQTSVPSLDRPHLSEHHSMSSYSQGGPHYSSVKVEDDHYSGSGGHGSHSSSMGAAHYQYNNNNANHIDWHGSYSSERNLHR